MENGIISDRLLINISANTNPIYFILGEFHSIPAIPSSLKITYLGKAVL
ncbi:hypothetical protein ADIARSV_3555 [Arcticibacter svalbardensis MN12-7]|uniref:Uncharacterized protein n=1 Tax=Arcticibacter svalbardensis MN12-7 TaxID=1150600 RepID=R9GP33_9SPHI|nr:hypothetical protein ADIARSV_3555 [Arcticibacter svalbardensis MN12-7]